MEIYNAFTVLVDRHSVKVELLAGDEFLISINDDSSVEKHIVFQKKELMLFADKIIAIAESGNE